MTQQSKYKGWAIPAVGAAAVLSLGLFAAGCGGGGGGAAATSATGTTTTLTASAGDGPVKGSIITVVDQYGATQATSAATDTYGLTTLNVPTSTTYPLKTVATGGTDQVSGKTLSVPLLGIVNSSADNYSHATPLGTLIIMAAQKIAGGNFANVTAADLTSAKDKVLTAFGATSITADILNANAGGFDSYSAAGFAVLNEQIAELFRRVGMKANTDLTTDPYMSALVDDLYTDGLLDGYSGSTILPNAAYSSVAIVANAKIQESLNNGTFSAEGTSVSMQTIINTFNDVMKKSGAASTQDAYGDAGAAIGKVIADAYTNLSKAAALSIEMNGGITSAVRNAVKAGVTNVSNSIYTDATAPITVVDDFAGTTTTATVTTPSNGVLTLALGNIKAAGLLAVVKGTSTKSPYANVTVKHLVKAATKTSTITAEIFDVASGSTGKFTREANEGTVKAVYDVSIGSTDGNTLSINVKAGGTAAVTFTNRAGTAGSATLTNASVDVVSVTSGTGVNGSDTIKLQLGKLFALNNSLVTAFQGVSTMTGNFAVRISFTNFAVVDEHGNTVSSIEMTFTGN